MKTRAWRWGLAILTAVVLMFSVGAFSTAQAGTSGGILRYGMLSDPVNWAPHNVVDCQSQVIMAQIWSGLLRYNDKEEITGDLAESWEWVDNKTIVFHLRKNVKWHNGDALTADQVVKSELHRMDPKAGVDAKTLSNVIDKWEAVDSHTIKLTLKHPDITILRWLTIVPGKDFVLHPAWDEKTCGRSAESTIGTGPFKYKSYEPGVGVELVKNPDFFIKGMPKLDGIKFVIIPDSEARLTGLIANDLDMVEHIDFQSLPRVKGNKDIYIPEGGAGYYGGRLILDMALPPTNDVRVRKALDFAINRDLIVNAVLNGDGAPIWGGFIPPGRFGYAEELANTLSYDPEKAKALLAEAGWTDSDGDGKLDKDGQPMHLSFMTYGPSWYSQVAEVFQANVRDIGIECDIEVKPWPEYCAIREKILALPPGKASQVNILGSTLWGLDLADFPLYIGKGGAYNFNRYENPKVQKLLHDAFGTTDDAKREEMLRKIQALMIEDVPHITPCWVTRAEVVRTSVKNFHHLGQDGCFGNLLWETNLEK